MTTTNNTPAPAYARHRTVDEVVALATAQGIAVDTRKHDDTGHDYITVHMPGPTGEVVPVLYNTVNGRFFHASADVVHSFTSDTTDHDGQPWFDAMRALFYVNQEGA